MGKCVKCKHIVALEDMQVVEIKSFKTLGINSNETRYYCPEHKKPYDKIISRGFFKNEVEVDAEGNPIDYKCTEKHFDTQWHMNRNDTHYFQTFFWSSFLGGIAGIILTLLFII